jgi:WD40 repeat protein
VISNSKVENSKSPASASTNYKALKLYKNNNQASHFLLTSLCASLLLVANIEAQRRGPGRDLPRSAHDIVLSTSFSPDGRTLAIARGSSDVAQRDGRIELWDTTSGELRHTIAGFDGPVWSLSFSPDGKTLVSGSTEVRDVKIQEKASERAGRVFAELKWWDPQSGELKKKVTVPGEGRISVQVAHSPDGKSLVTVESFYEMGLVASQAMNSGPDLFSRTSWGIILEGVELKLLDAQTGEPKVKIKGGSKTYPGHYFRGPSRFRIPNISKLERPMFSPDGELLAAFSSDDVKLWNTRTGEEIRKLKKFNGRPRAIAFSPDGRILAVSIIRLVRLNENEATPESEIRLYDTSNGNVIHKITAKNNFVSSLLFAPNEPALLIGTLAYQGERTIGMLRIWDLKTNRFASIDTHEDQTVESLALSTNGGALAMQSGPSTVELWDTQAWKVRYAFEGGNQGGAVPKAFSRFLLSVKQVVAVAFSPDGKTLTGEVPDDGIKLWDTRTGEVKKRIVEPQNDGSIVGISSDGKTLVHFNNRDLTMWDVLRGTSRAAAVGAAGPISAVALTSDGQTMAIGSNHEIILRKTDKEDRMRTLAGHEADINCLVFSDDGRILVSGDEDGGIKIWDAETGQQKRTIVSGGKVTAVALAPSGQTLASAGEDFSVSLWDQETGALRQRLKKHDHAVNALAFSPDGKLLASGGDDRTVIIWDVAAGKSRRTLKGHDLTVTSLAFSPDGNLVASGSGNASVVLWNVQTGKLDRILR